ncbi:MAG: hypothetical protein JWO04_3539 [Gammaproteobacteria bacterium]|nr:hypothetical protein [Gammaproteobacteria bacterium]
MIDTPIPGGLLWHYTDFGAAKGIIQTDSMWASDLRFVNDTVEFKYAQDLMSELFAAPGVVPDIDVGWPPAGIFSSMIPYMNYVRDNSIFVTCFSNESDDLSQWRAYAHTPPSFSIGFDPNLLKNRMQTLQFDFESCVYTRAEQKKLIKSAVDAMFAEAYATVPNFAILTPLQRNTNFISSICARHGREQFTDLAARFKSEKFEAENEVRAIQRVGVGSQKEWTPGFSKSCPPSSAAGDMFSVL